MPLTLASHQGVIALYPDNGTAFGIEEGPPVYSHKPDGW